MCAVLTVLDVFVQKNYWKMFTLSTLRTKRFHNDFKNVEQLKKILFEKN